MSFSRGKRSGGLLVSDVPAHARFSAALRSGPDVSWLPRCRVGDDQGVENACAIFALASWAEIMHGYEISDTQALEVYRATLRELGRPDAGLTFAEAFVAAHKANWLPGARALEAVHDLSELSHQPILAGYRVTGALDNPNAAGCLDHAADDTTRGYHGMVIVAHGSLLRVPGGPFVYVENSWQPWGWKGIGVMTEPLHRKLIRELWIVR
jgi:hypothetical protein